MLRSKVRAVTRNLVLSLAVMLLVLGSSAVTALEGDSATEGLFAETAVRGSIDRAGDPTVIRSRYVGLNLDLLRGEDGAPRDLAVGSTLMLNLFDDLALVVQLDRVEPGYGGGFTWVGWVQGDPLSLVTLSVSDGVMAGTVLIPGAVFEIGYAGNGVHVVSELDQSAFPQEAEQIPVSTPEGEQDAIPAAVADDGSIIDVMVVYTQEAETEAGGPAAMLSLINSAISQTNSTYTNSQITQRLRLVYTGKVSYNEVGLDNPYDNDLTRLQAKNDGYMDIVHTWRDTYHADEVALIVGYPPGYLYCGMAYLMSTLTTSFESNAFAVVERECVTGNLSFAHELGHNMGAHHDWYAVQKYNQGPGLYSYSYGYVNTSTRWRTIMAYNDACGDLGFYCERKWYWSNPNVDLDGVPVGTASADNHRTLNASAWTVANFRCMPPDAPTGLTAAAVPLWRIDLSWNDNSNNEDGFRIQRSLNGSTWSTRATVAANTTSYADTSPTPGTLYYYRVIAFNACDDSYPSNTASATLPVVVGPLVYDGHVIDDDNSQGTSGNDNGLAECEETVDLTVMLRNAGNTEVEGIGSVLTPVGGTGLGDIYDITNLVSDYPDIAGGTSAGNLLAFGFSVKPMEDFAHWIDFELEITADNWSGGTVEFSLPFVCKANAGYRFYMPQIYKN